MTRTKADYGNGRGNFFPARLVLAAAAANDYYKPQVVMRRGRRFLKLICDVEWTPITAYSQLVYARVTHREVCLLTQGLHMRMYEAVAGTMVTDQHVYFFTRRELSSPDYEEVFVEVVAGASTNTALGQIIPIVPEASDAEEQIDAII